MRSPAQAILTAAVAICLAHGPGASRQARPHANSFPVPAPLEYLETLRVQTSVSTPRPTLGPALAGYRVLVDGVELAASDASSVETYPHLVRRRYPSGVVEESTRLDEAAALAVRLTAPRAVRFEVVPVTAAGTARVAVRASGSRGANDSRPGPAVEAWFVVAAAPDGAGAGALASRLARDAAARTSRQHDAIARRLLDSFVATSDPEFDRGLAWAKVLSDRNASGGDRSALSSIQGRLLVTGRLAEARALVAALARRQNADEADAGFGLVANDAQTTCRLVRAAFEYVLYSGDFAFAREIYPAVLRATDGAIRRRVDSEGLLAGEPPVVQALWFAQLEASARLAHLVTDKEASERWERFGARVRRAYRELGSTQVDRVGLDRLIGMTASFEPLFSLAEGRILLRECVDGLVHTGADAGPLVPVLVRYRREDLAFRIAKAKVAQLLARVADGGDTTAADAVAAADLVRDVYTAFLGLRPDATAEQIAFDPAVPRELGMVRAVVPFAGGQLRLTLEPLGAGRTRCTLVGARLQAPIEVVVGAPGAQGMLEGAESFMLAPHTAVERLHARRPLPPRADPGPLSLPNL
jgi:hypothetical protein